VLIRNGIFEASIGSAFLEVQFGVARTRRFLGFVSQLDFVIFPKLGYHWAFLSVFRCVVARGECPLPKDMLVDA
jgi:hypothetical protein